MKRDMDPKGFHAGNGGKAVVAVEKTLKGGVPVTESAEHDCPVRDGFIARYSEISRIRWDGKRIIHIPQ